MINGTVIADNDARTYYQGQGRTFYANNRFWVFYERLDTIYCKSSVDGINWTSEVTIRASTVSAYNISFAWDGTMFHYAYAKDSDIYYRSFTPDIDGGISWTAAEVVADNAHAYEIPTICVDSNGYVWIGAVYGTSDYAIRSGNNDGTWGTTGVGPYRLTSTGASNQSPKPTALTDGKVLWCYDSGERSILYDSGWGSVENIYTDTGETLGPCHRVSIVAHGDDVYTTTNDYTNKSLLLLKRSSGGTWSIVCTVASIDGDSGAMIIDGLSNIIYIFYNDDDVKGNIYMTKYYIDIEQYSDEIVVKTGGTFDQDYFNSGQTAVSDGYIVMSYFDTTPLPDELGIIAFDVSGVYLTEANGAGPTSTIVSEVRFQSADRYEADIDYPIKIQDSGYSYSYWKTIALKLVGNFSKVSNIRHYSDGTIGWSLGTDGRVVRGNRDAGDHGCPDTSYDQATGTPGETGDELGANHSYYSGQTTKVADIESDTSGSPATIDSTEYTSADISKAIVLQVRVDDDATQGLTADETFVWLYDEI